MNDKSANSADSVPIQCVRNGFGFVASAFGQQHWLVQPQVDAAAILPYLQIDRVVERLAADLEYPFVRSHPRCIILVWIRGLPMAEERLPSAENRQLSESRADNR